MNEVKASHFRGVQVIWAVCQIVVKWMAGVLLYKLAQEGFATGVAAEDHRPLLRFVFLKDVEFFQVVGLTVLSCLVSLTCGALLESWSVRKSVNTGRSLRNEIINKAVTESGGTGNTDIAQTAADLITKIKLIENFVEFDEQWIFIEYCVIALALLLAIIFSWYSGVAAVVVYASATLWASVFEKQRHKHLVAIETNAAQVNARLLDVIKNGVKIKIMEQLDSEQAALTEIEKHGDGPRAADTTIKVISKFGRGFGLFMVPTVMIVVGWFIIKNWDSENAFDITSSILISTLLLDEGHKATMKLTFVYDKKIDVDEAKAVIDQFLGKESITEKSSDSDPAEKTLAGGSNDDKDDTQFSDSEKGQCLNTNAHSSSWNRNSVEQCKGINLKGVVLRYPDRDEPALNYYSQSFERGKIHALVGESGSGKSTALKVVANLFQPESGVMEYWNGIKIAYVSQEQKLFSRSVRENVTYGANKEISDEEVWEALKTAAMDKWVKSLPNGLDQLLATGEACVSGGQLQRLNLAHLFCTCQDADLIILDEVLSALDPTSREMLLNELETFLSGGTKTALIITHHQEMLRICDEVHEMLPPKLLVHSRKHRSSIAGVRSLYSDPMARSTIRSRIRESVTYSVNATVVGERILPASVVEEVYGVSSFG